MKPTLLLLSTVGVAMAAPASPATPIEAVARSPSSASYTGAEIVARWASGSSSPALRPRQSSSAAVEDPNACYADCVIAGGGDWECICLCISCGGSTPPPIA